jgi:propionyl-CoA synthetase
MTNYADIHRASLENPDRFWGEAAEGIDWATPWHKVLDNPAADTYRWFAGGRLNTCYNALDRHVERGRGDQTAIIYDSAVTDTQRKISYTELLADVSRFAGALAANGVNTCP